VLVVLLGGADSTGEWVEVARRVAARLSDEALAWYGRTPPAERMTWGGLAACAVLGMGVALERAIRLRRSRAIPEAFVERFQKRLGDGQLDAGKALDYCELNPSAASRVALAAVQRWGRPTADLERGVVLARRREVDALRRNIRTLRRVAALAPLVGLLGSLTAAGRVLANLAPGASIGPALAGALGPLTAGVALAILALVAYDGLTGRVEGIAGELDRIGAETVDAIALAAGPESRPSRAAAPVRTPHAVFIPAPRMRDEP
jgi:biopolymer transport protein ExbB